VGGEDGVVFDDEGGSELDGVVGCVEGFVGGAEEGGCLEETGGGHRVGEGRGEVCS
jgi:hypothetical protein